MEIAEIREKMIECVARQMENLDNVDSKELGEAVDIIKDLAEAEYYEKVVEAMKDKDIEDIVRV